MRGEGEFGFAVFSNDEGRLFVDAIGLFQGLAKKQIGKGAFLATLFMLEAQGFFTSPVRKGGKSLFQFLWGDRGEVVSHIKFIVFLHNACSNWL